MKTMNALILPLLVSVGLNWLLFVPAYIFKTDKITDISYSTTFILLAVYGFMSSEMTTTQTIVFIATVVWAVRLGGYLFYRIHKIGRDTRFDEMRNSILRFFGFWTLQGITVFLVSIPSILLFSNSLPRIHPTMYLGVIFYVSGLIVESIADWQKFKFKINGGERWIESGIWRKVRHPNYTGEMMVWIGIYLICVGNLTLDAAWIGLISPLFIILMLRYVSGIPLLERSAKKKYGNDSDYLKYVKRTGRLWPKL